MSGSAKKRRATERQRARRAAREAERQQRANDAFEACYPGGVAAFHEIMAERERNDAAVRDVEFAAFTDPIRHMYAGG